MTGAALGVLATLALSILLGSIIFFSFVTTPILFRTLERNEARRCLRALFPVYYRLLAACGGFFVAAVALGSLLTRESRARGGLETVLGAVMLALTLYAWRVVLPRVERARVRMEGADPTDHSALEQRYFKSQHTLSVRINAVVIVLVLGCLLLRLIPR